MIAGPIRFAFRDRSVLHSNDRDGASPGAARQKYEGAHRGSTPNGRSLLPAPHRRTAVRFGVAKRARLRNGDMPEAEANVGCGTSIDPKLWPAGKKKKEKKILRSRAVLIEARGKTTGLFRPGETSAPTIHRRAVGSITVRAMPSCTLANTRTR